jgi:hypothetical protein
LVEVQEKERKKIHTSEEKKRTFAARDLEVSLDRADAFIEGGPDVKCRNESGWPTRRFYVWGLLTFPHVSTALSN